MQFNVENSKNIKFILVQLPEPIDSKKNKVAYNFLKENLGINNPTVFDICKERVVRASKKLKTTIDNKIKEKENKIKELKSRLDIDNSKNEIKKLEDEVKSLRKQNLEFNLYHLF